MTESDIPLVLTVDEAAALLRFDRKTIYAMVRDGELAAARARGGRAIRIPRWAVLDLLSGKSAERARR